MRRLRPSLFPCSVLPQKGITQSSSLLLRRRSAQLHLLSVITFPNLSSSPSLSPSFSCNQQEGEHNTTRTFYYYQRKITDPIPRWSVRGRERRRERDKRERAIRVSAEIRDGILIRQVSLVIIIGPGDLYGTGPETNWHVRTSTDQ